MNEAFELLERLTERLPPSSKHRHSLTKADDAEALVLTLCANGGFYKFTLDLEDFDKDPYSLVDEVLDLYEKIVKEAVKASPVLPIKPKT